MELIQTITQTTSQRGISVDMTSFDWSAWSVVLMECRFQFSGTDSNDTSSITADGIAKLSSAGSRTPPGPMLLILFPGRDPNRTVLGVTFPGGDLLMGLDSYQNITALSTGLSAPHQFPVGTIINLYGIS